LSDPDVVVIGSGAGGMTAAVALARTGRRVLVLEQHDVPGGWCHSFQLDGHRFSPGVHYVGELGPGGRLRAVMEGLGVAGDLTFLQLDSNGYDRVFAGTRRFDVPSGRAALESRLRARFPAEVEGVGRYLDLIEAMARELNAGVDRQLGLSRVTGIDGAGHRTLREHGVRPLRSLLNGLIEDPFLRTILEIHCGNHGTAPSRAPSALHAATAMHFMDGAWYPAGGAFSIPRAFLRELKRHRGELRVRSRVDRILIDGAAGGARAVGVRLTDGTEIRARRVVSNADPGITFGELIEPEHLPSPIRRRLATATWSVSTMSLFAATDADLREAGLTSGNAWLSKDADIEAGFRLATAGSTDEVDEIPLLFVTATSLKDPTKRHRGQHTLEAFCFVSWRAFERFACARTQREPAYEKLKLRMRDRMLDRLDAGFPGLSERLDPCALGTPLTNRHFVRTTNGCIYGTEKVPGQIGPFAWSVRSGIAGLTACGASTTTQGVYGAVLSGLAAARDIVGGSLGDLLTPGASTLNIHPAEDIAVWPPDLRERARKASAASSRGRTS